MKESLFFEKINATDKLLARLTQKKKEKTQMTSIRNKTDITTGDVDIKGTLGKCVINSTYINVTT